MRLGIVAAVVLACSSSWATPKPRQPPGNQAQLDEIRDLEKELTQLQIKQATFAAAKVARKLYVAQKKLDGDDAIETIRRKESLASLLHQTGADVEAVALYKELIATAEKLHGAQSREVSMAVSMLNSVYWGEQHWDDVEVNLRRLLDLAKVLDGDQSSAYADVLGQLGAIYNLRNEYASAQRTYEQVLALREKLAKTPDDSSLLGAVGVLASMYWQTNQRAKAIPLFDREIAMVSGPKVSLPLAAAIISGVASTYHYTGRDDLAAPLRKRVADMYLKEIARLEKDKPDDPYLPSMIGMLGFGYRQANDWPNADRWLTRALELDEKRTHFSGWSTVLAEVKRAEGKPREALALLEQADADLHKLSPNTTATRTC